MSSSTVEVPINLTVVWTCSTHEWAAGPVDGVVGVAPRGSTLKVPRNSSGQGCPWESFAHHVEGPRTAGFIQAVPVIGRILKHAPVIGLYGGGCAIGWPGFDETWLKDFRTFTDETTSTTHWVEAPVSRKITIHRNPQAPPRLSFTTPGTNRLLG